MKNLVYAMVALLCLLGSVLVALYITMLVPEMYERVTGKVMGGIQEEERDCEPSKPDGTYMQQVSGTFIPADETACEGLDKATRTLAVMSYEGKTVGNFYIGQRDHESYVVPVYVDKLAGPVNLILGSYEQILWDFKFKDPADKALIKQVIVGGYYDSGVRNLAPETKVLFAGQMGKQSCVTAPEYESNWTKEGLVKYVKETYELEGEVAAQNVYTVDSVLVSEETLKGTKPAVREPSGEDENGKPVKKVDMKGFVGGSDVRTPAPLVIEDIPSGQAGLDYLVKKGVLRMATEADVKAFEAAKAKKEKETGKVEESYGSVSTQSYVLQQPKMQMPRGMFGANAGATIVKLKDSYEIEGGSHNSVCSMVDGSCSM